MSEYANSSNEVSEVLLTAIACAWDCAKRINHQSAFEPLKLKRVLIPQISNATEKQIVLIKREWGAKSIWGQLEDYGSKAEILYSGHLNHCWKRFVITKELAHLLCDTSNQRATTDRQIEDLIAWLTIGSSPLDLDTPVGAEEMAYMIALGILLPEDHRPAIIRKYPEKIHYQEIADVYKIPEAMVRVYFSTDYVRLMDSARSSLAHSLSA